MRLQKTGRVQTVRKKKKKKEKNIRYRFISIFKFVLTFDYKSEIYGFDIVQIENSQYFSFVLDVHAL